MKLSEDKEGEVRDAALNTLGIFKGRLGESTMSKYLSNLNPQKLDKVNSAASTIQPSKYDRPEKKEPTKAAAPPKGKAPPAKTAAPVKKTASAATPKEEAKKEETFDDMPISGGSNKNKNTFDDQPIGGGSNKNAFDDVPIGGKKPNTMLDDQPIGGKPADVVVGEDGEI